MGCVFHPSDEMEVSPEDIKALHETVDIGEVAHYVVSALTHLTTLASLEDIVLDSRDLTCGVSSRGVTTPEVIQVAYAWIETNWARLQLLLSENCELAPSLPQINHQGDWMLCVASLLEHQMGLKLQVQMIHKQLRYALIPCVSSLWGHLSVDMHLYLEWLQGSEPDTYGVSRTFLASCLDCEFQGKYAGVPCVLQCGQFRCLDLATKVTPFHRSTFVPLDVGTLDSFEQLVRRSRETLHASKNKHHSTMYELD